MLVAVTAGAEGGGTGTPDASAAPAAGTGTGTTAGPAEPAAEPPQGHRQEHPQRRRPGGPPSPSTPSTPTPPHDLARQTYLLTGRRTLALEAVERAFTQAWGRWPEVASDPDPVGWVRAAAYEYALSPWHRFRRAHRHADRPPAEPADRILLDALLALPAAHRRTVLLYDGVGLDLPDTAAETEASTPTMRPPPPARARRPRRPGPRTGRRTAREPVRGAARAAGRTAALPSRSTRVRRRPSAAAASGGPGC